MRNKLDVILVIILVSLVMYTAMVALWPPASQTLTALGGFSTAHCWEVYGDWSLGDIPVKCAALMLKGE